MSTSMLNIWPSYARLPKSCAKRAGVYTTDGVAPITSRLAAAWGFDGTWTIALKVRQECCDGWRFEQDQDLDKRAHRLRPGGEETKEKKKGN